ncbi:histidine phosphatase family protein [Actinotignum urinale]|uniref:Histidine phosphatase family protein n=1 Tax=Actinotignum urinale TaxID=190146 RepID=A0ABU5G824_9ACTO|nr:histidine phosphatase family protein [Actinotignum urinale]MDY5133491.1 histidine phosphatase family protein [Actinotignum urinale]MDY5160035.1 histidine phosphatase family protein [Actinotignum urinale]
MPADYLILWRHGQTDFNKQMRIQGATDIPLNDLGLRQARESAQSIVAKEPTRIISSPLSRALTTAQCLATEVGLDVTTDERLVERRFGEFEGKTRAEIEVEFPGEFIHWQRHGMVHGIGMETRESVGERFAQAVGEASDAMDGGKLVVVAHGAAIACGVSHLLGLYGSWGGVRGLDNCHYAILQRCHSGNPDWRIEAYNLY